MRLVAFKAIAVQVILLTALLGGLATLGIIGPEFRSHDRSGTKLGARMSALAVLALVALWL